MSECYDVIITSINESDLNQGQIFPNPIKNQLNIDLGNTYQKVSLIVYNALGQTMYDCNYDQLKSTSIDMNIPAGVYYLSIQTPTKLLDRIKFIKE
jgi:hypothetical protein